MDRLYRPTIRCSDVYRTYVNQLFHATWLDRNQIIRCALFTAAYNPYFLELMNEYKKHDVTPPPPLWSRSDHDIWMEQDAGVKEGGERINDDIGRKGSSTDFIEIFGAPTNSRSIPGTNIQSKQQRISNNKTPQQNRCQQPIERRTGALPSIQLSNNGGIRLDLR